jgi:protein gp37
MADTTLISWTDSTFNPWMGCAKCSPGCENCYAERLVSGRMGLKGLWGASARRVKTKTWHNPVKWNATTNGKPHRVFCGSLMDIFEDHPALSEWRSQLFDLICATPQLTWQLLTKRPENIRSMLPYDWHDGPYRNVWLGTTIESIDQSARVRQLAFVPAQKRFVSYEPALGPLTGLDLAGIDWVIYGGESGPGRRPDRIEWARELRDMCRAAKIPFFYKQASAPRPGQQHLLDGELVQ